MTSMYTLIDMGRNQFHHTDPFSYVCNFSYTGYFRGLYIHTVETTVGDE